MSTPTTRRRALQDVVNLGWKLAAQLKGWAPPGLLDAYQAERHPAAERMLSSTRAQDLLLAPGEQLTALRELISELLLPLLGTRMP